jgi:outer membrane protein OmpA-like peptidoglycan-associated protein
MIRTLSILAAASLFACAASAQTAMHYREGQRVDPQEVARILGHQAPIKTRSIRLLDSNDKVAQSGGPVSLSLPVRFGFDSAEIAATARPQLDALAEGIKLLPPSAVVMVEGHTDAVGTDEYNQRLSQRRAHAVKEYLVKQHGIDAKRLVDTGLGKSQPIEGTSPQAPENRRVQFRGA